MPRKPEDLLLDDDAPPPSRVVPAIVLSIALTSFIALAWYAYHAGTRSMKTEDLMLVEADTDPVKETPEDPGGMKIPNQDKSIFDAISSTGKGKQDEKVAPAPEEPMNKDTAKAVAPEDTTNTWINEKLHKDQDAAPPVESAASPFDAGMPPTEQAVEAKKVLPSADAPTPALRDMDQQTVRDFADGVAKPLPSPQAAAPATDAPAPVEIKQPEPVKLVEPAPELAKVTPKTVEKPAKKAEAPKAASVASGSSTVQLGAYRSEDEAEKAWKAASKKHAALSGKEHAIVKADLGAKGIYYRLRVLGVASDACAKLSAAGQACMAVK